MIEQGEAMLARWQEGDVRDMTGEMMDVTLDIITNTMFGLSVKEAMAENDLRGTFDHMHKLMAEKTRKEGIEPQEETDKRNRELMAGLQLLDKLIYGIIEERRQNPQEGRHDLLSILLRMGMSDKELRDQVTTIFLAGHETTANTLAWTWYLLLQNPEIEAKFHAELDHVLNGESPTAESLKDLTYTNPIVQESMRLYPAAWNMGRIAIEDVTIGDWEFKKGQSVLMSQFAMHRDPRWYDRPDEFIPDPPTPTSPSAAAHGYVSGTILR